MTRILALLMALLASIGTIAAPARAADETPLAQAFAAMRSGDWQAAVVRAAPDGPVARDIVEWHRLRAGQGDLASVVDFLDRRPDWPGLDWLVRRNEGAIAAAEPARVLAFFDSYPPQTAEGVLARAAALAGAGRGGEAEAGLVLGWRTMPMPAEVQAGFLAAHAPLLEPHHRARLDQMIWQRDMASARRALPLVGADYRALAEARIALHDMAAGVDGLIAAVPEALQGDPGLAYERFVWRHRKDRDEDAIALLLERSVSAVALGVPDAWADRRTALARTRMWAGDHARAYRIAAGHFLTAGSDFAELEWLAGYIALRFLDQPERAVDHFERFDAAVFTPISKGRAGYWLGRARAEAGDAEGAQIAWRMGAEYQTSFYGLLAAEAAGQPFDPALVTPPTPPGNADFDDNAVFQAGMLLLAAEHPDLAERFFTHLTESLSADDALRLGQVALDMDRPHLAVMIAKRAAQAGHILPGVYYPLHPVGEMRLPSPPEMVLSIARRESEFDPGVVSGAGARGLMQVMPATAAKVAADLELSGAHSTDRLLSDWRYNARLGGAYLAEMAEAFDGNAVMVAAAYNAGPGRPRGWMAERGDPRGGSVEEMIDWIEHIPFRETRNYVMRVTESLPVYRARLGKPPLPVPFSRELTGATLTAP